jgi:hypothetical protein
MRPRALPQRRGNEEQRSELGCLADIVPGGVHSVEFCREGASGETTMETVLNAPGGALAHEVKAIPTQGVTDQVVDRTKPVERATELTAEQGMKALSGSGGGGDLERSAGAYCANELFIARIGSAAPGERHARCPRAAAPGEARIQAISF